MTGLPSEGTQRGVPGRYTQGGIPGIYPPGIPPGTYTTLYTTQGTPVTACPLARVAVPAWSLVDQCHLYT